MLYFLTGWVRNGVFIRSMEMVNLLMMVSYASFVLYKFVEPVKNKNRTAAVCIVGAFIILSLMLASAYLLMWLSKLG